MSENILSNRVVRLSSKKENTDVDSRCLLVGKVESGDMVLIYGKVLLVRKVVYFKARKTFRFYCTDLIHIDDFRRSEFNFSIKDHRNIRVIEILK